MLHFGLPLPQPTLTGCFTRRCFLVAWDANNISGGGFFIRWVFRAACISIKFRLMLRLILTSSMACMVREILIAGADMIYFFGRNICVWYSLSHAIHKKHSQSVRADFYQHVYTKKAKRTCQSALHLGTPSKSPAKACI